MQESTEAQYINPLINAHKKLNGKNAPAWDNACMWCESVCHHHHQTGLLCATCIVQVCVSAVVNMNMLYDWPVHVLCVG